jgi:hypothetical protein
MVQCDARCGHCLRHRGRDLDLPCLVLRRLLLSCAHPVVLALIHHQPQLDRSHQLATAAHLKRAPHRAMESVQVENFVVSIRRPELGVPSLQCARPGNVVAVRRPLEYPHIKAHCRIIHSNLKLKHKMTYSTDHVVDESLSRLSLSLNVS